MGNNSHLTVYKASAGSGKTFRLAVQYITMLVKDIIAAECSTMLPEKVCVIPKAQYVYMKKSQTSKIDVDIIYDGLTFSLPEKKCAKFTGTYKYKTKLDKVSEFISGDKSETTIPKAEIVSRY